MEQKEQKVDNTKLEQLHKLISNVQSCKEFVKSFKENHYIKYENIHLDACEWFLSMAVKELFLVEEQDID